MPPAPHAPLSPDAPRHAGDAPALSVVALLAATCMAAGSAHAVPVMWTDWTSITGNAASGTMNGVSVSITSSASMNGVSPTACSVRATR